MTLRGCHSSWLGVALLCLAACRAELHPASGPANESERTNDVTAATEQRLSGDALPLLYALDLTIDPHEPEFSGTARIDVNLARALTAIPLHARGLRVRRATLTREVGSAREDVQVAIAIESGLIELRPSRPVGPGVVALEIEYAAPFDEHLHGLYRVESDGRAYAFTQFEPIYARQAFPCFDEPRFKTPFDITLRVPSDAVAIGNTKTVSRTESPGGLSEVRFARTEKLPSYLVAFAVGPLDVVGPDAIDPSEVRASPLALRGIAAHGRGAELRHALDETPALLQSLERYVGIAYPYDKLDLIAVPDFASGAMENAGAITFRDTLLLMGPESPEWQRRASISVNAHELAHQWFGNLVTMPWWDDIWLNEAFATWLSGRVLGEVHPEFNAEFARVAAVDRAMEVDSRESARQIRQPIATEHDIENAFDAITYIKGSAVLGMFEQYLGEATFRRGLMSYLEQHRFGSATSEDLFRALEAASAQPVTPAFSSFIEQPGVPRVGAELVCARGARPMVRLTQARYVPLGSRAERARLWQVPICLRHGSAADPGSEQCTLLARAEAELPLATEQCPSWLFPNAKAKGYYRWSLAPADFDALLARGFERLGTAERLSLLSNAEAAARSGELGLARLLAVTRRVGKERPRELVQAALGVLVRLREALLAPAELDDYRRSVHSLVAPRFAEVGLIPSPPELDGGRANPESGDIKLLRPILAGALALEARDAALRRELDGLGRARLGLARDPRLARLPSELLELALSVAVQVGGAPVIERMLSVLASSTDGIERSRILTALGNNEDPALTPQILELSLAKDLRNNERMSTIAGQMRQPSTRDVTYDWVTLHFDALLESFGKKNAAGLVQLVGLFCSEKNAESAREFFTPRATQLSGGPRLLGLALESVESCAAFADQHRASAKAEFAKLADE